MNGLSTSLLFLLVAALCGVAGTWLARAFAFRFRIMNEPNRLVPGHNKAVAYLGGVGVFAGFAGAILILRGVRPEAFADLPAGFLGRLFVPATAFLLLGLIDDLRVFRPALKFGLQVVAGIVAVQLGFVFPFFGLAWPDALLSLLWIVALVNAFNLTDVCDGLVGSISVATFLALGIFGAAYSVPVLLIAGACVGFLFFNRPPASIYLGDAGSHLLGFLAAALVLKTNAPFDSPWPAIPCMLLFVAVPVLEMTLLIVARTRKGLKWWLGSKDHFSIRLQTAGFSKWSVDLMACGFTAVSCATGFVLGRGVATESAVAIVVWLLLTTAICRKIWRLEVPS